MDNRKTRSKLRYSKEPKLEKKITLPWTSPSGWFKISSWETVILYLAKD